MEIGCTRPLLRRLVYFVVMTRQRSDGVGFENARCDVLGNAFSLTGGPFDLPFIDHAWLHGCCLVPDEDDVLMQAPSHLKVFKDVVADVDPSLLTRRLFERASHRMPELRSGVDTMASPNCGWTRSLPSAIFVWKVSFHTQLKANTSMYWSSGHSSQQLYGVFDNQSVLVML
jgi:hypothetical protein